MGGKYNISAKLDKCLDSQVDLEETLPWKAAFCAVFMRKRYSGSGCFYGQILIRKLSLKNI